MLSDAAAAPGPVAVDGRALAGEPTGIGVWVREVVGRWAAAGRPVTLLTEQRGVVDIGARVVALAPPFHVNAWRWARAHGARYLSPDSLLVAAALGRRATVVVHDLAPLERPDLALRRTRLAYRLLLARAVRRCAAVVVPSQATRTDLLRRAPAVAERVHVVAEAARSLPAPGSLPPGVRAPYLLFTGTLQPRKHPVELAEAFVAAAPPPWQLVLAGPRGWLPAAAAARLHALAAGGRVRVLGYVDDAALAALLAQAGAFGYPSAYEGFGLPVLEAMAAGVPVVATGAPALREVAGDAALLVDLDGPDPWGAALRAALSRVLTDEPLRERLRVAGPARAAAYSWDATAARVWEVVSAPAGPRR